MAIKTPWAQCTSIKLEVMGYYVIAWRTCSEYEMLQFDADKKEDAYREMKRIADTGEFINVRVYEKNCTHHYRYSKLSETRIPKEH